MFLLLFFDFCFIVCPIFTSANRWEPVKEGMRVSISGTPVCELQIHSSRDTVDAKIVNQHGIVIGANVLVGIWHARIKFDANELDDTDVPVNFLLCDPKYAHNSHSKFLLLRLPSHTNIAQNDGAGDNDNLGNDSGGDWGTDSGSDMSIDNDAQVSNDDSGGPADIGNEEKAGNDINVTPEKLLRKAMFNAVLNVPAITRLVNELRPNISGLDTASFSGVSFNSVGAAPIVSEK